MFAIRATALSLYLPKALCECSRSVRMGVSIPLKKIKSPIKRKPKETIDGEQFRQLEYDNPGIAHGLRSRISSGYDVDPYEDAEEFSNTDMDAFDTGYTITHNRELAEKDFRTKHFYNVKRKYFKEEKLPNMVTYIEKQQIKHLYEADPEYYTVEKLAESFPASPSIIKKIINSPFSAHSVKTVQKHDESVRKNWDLFRQGKLHFDKELAAHYAKFAGRQRIETNENEIKKYLPPPPDFSNQPIREFSNIIASSKKYKKLKEDERKALEIEESGKIIHTSKNMQMKVIDEDDVFTHYNDINLTLDVLRNKIGIECRHPTDALILERAPKKSLPPPSNVEAPSDAFRGTNYSNHAVEVKQLESVNPKAEAEKRQSRKKTRSSVPQIEESTDIYKEFKFLNKETGIVDEKLPYNFAEEKLKHVRLKIHIPENAWQKDKLYRIKDCFYDDQGIFLYRVPGLF